MNGEMIQKNISFVNEYHENAYVNDVKKTNRKKRMLPGTVFSSFACSSYTISINES